MNQGEWQTVRNHDEYEIWSEHPYPIRKKSNHRVVSESISGSGYICLSLNQRLFLKHRIIAKHFLPNPENLNEVDHINRVKRDNRLCNLRWASKSENSRNRSSHNGIQHEFTNILPGFSLEFRQYEKHEISDNYFVSYHDGDVSLYLKVSDEQYRILHPNTHKQHGLQYFSVGDMNGKRRSILKNKLKRHLESIIEDELNQQEAE